MTANSEPAGKSNAASAAERSTADNIKQLTDASRELFQAGKQMAENLDELSHRVEHATDVGSQIVKSPWLVAGGAILAGLLILMFSRKD